MQGAVVQPTGMLTPMQVRFTSIKIALFDGSLGVTSGLLPQRATLWLVSVVRSIALFCSVGIVSPWHAEQRD
jgi:hypothetical protein